MVGRAVVVAPSWDLSYATSRMHGAAAQAAMIRQAIRFCTRRRTAVDAGAHIGLTALALSDRFERVYAFEPVPENFLCLSANVDIGVSTHNVALGSHSGECSMEQPGENSGCWSARPGSGTRIEPLDSFELENVDFIKIDVEGFEGEVLQGAVDALKRCRPVVLFESNGLGRKFFGESWVDPATVLEPLGYRKATQIQKNEVWTC
jgi:FkbM family methyltransferase